MAWVLGLTFALGSAGCALVAYGVLAQDTSCVVFGLSGLYLSIFVLLVLGLIWD